MMGKCHASHMMEVCRDLHVQWHIDYGLEGVFWNLGNKTSLPAQNHIAHKLHYAMTIDHAVDINLFNKLTETRDKFLVQ